MRPSPPQSRHPISQSGMEAVLELGFPASADLNGADQEGVARVELTVVDGVRQSAADAYLTPVTGRPNLRVITRALVHRVLISGERCTGAEFSVDGVLRTAEATTEVVLCAGVIGSPQLLMLSGLGPARMLRDHGISVRSDLPEVGRNLQDHPFAGVVYSAARSMPAMANNHSDIVAALRTDPALAAPNLHVLFMDTPYYPPSMTGPDNGYTIGFSLLLPTSKGSVTLATADPEAPPLIDPRFLADENDMTAMMAGLSLARELGGTRAMAGWRQAEALPGPDVRDPGQLRDFLRRDTGIYFHPVGTCRLGSDAGAVVDTRLRVRGTERLRVVDASVMPSIVAANTNATVLAIAERAAEMIKEAAA
jgi:choline dehydrogenase